MKTTLESPQPAAHTPGQLSPELKLKAQWVADLMKADKVTAEMVTPELAIAYFDEAGRRVIAIQNTYLTRNGAREAMQAAVLGRIWP